MSEGFFEADHDGILTEADPAFCRMVGLDAVAAVPLGRTVFPEDPDVAGWLAGVGRDAARRSGPHPAHPERRWFELVVRRTDRGMSGLLLDRTDERDLVERYASLVAESPFGVVIIQDGLVVYSNDAQERLYPTLGRVASELLSETMHPDDLELVVGRIRARESGLEVPTNYRYRHVYGGQTRWQEVWSTRFVYRGRPALLAMSIDVTEEVETQEQLLHAQKMEAVGRLAGGVAHDINNLLTVMGMASSMARHGTSLDEVQSELDQIDAAAARAAALTAQLLTFSRRQPASPVPVDVHRAVDQLTQMLRRLVGEDILLQVVHGGYQPTVRLDPGQLDQVVTNLVVNARDAMPGGGRVRIETAVEGDHVVIRVADQGHGIPAKDLAQVFEPFFTTKGVGYGTGLGLSTVLGIVQGAEGTVDMRSTVGEGTQVIVRLPSHQPASVPAGSESPDEEPPCRGTILVVEDELGVRDLVMRALERAGFACHGASDGHEALGLLQEGLGPDLVVSDVVMPRMSGIELSDIVERRWPTLPLILMTGYAADSTPLGRTVLRKPFLPQVLVAAVGDALSRLGADSRVG